MPSASRLLSSLLMGAGLGVGPYGAAVASGGIPTSQEITTEVEENKFGEMCLLDEDLCNAMKEWKYTPDYEKEETSDQSESSGPKKGVSPSLLEARYDDVCSWGFFIEEYNTLSTCKPEKKPSTSDSGVEGSEDQQQTQTSVTL